MIGKKLTRHGTETVFFITIFIFFPILKSLKDLFNRLNMNSPNKKKLNSFLILKKEKLKKYLISDILLLFGVHVAKPVVWFNSKPSGYFRTLYSGFIVLSSDALNCIYTVLFTSTLIEVFPVMLGDSFSLTKLNCVYYCFKLNTFYK